MNRNELEVVAAMERRGGSFVSALAAAFRHADADNFRRLREAFPDYWSAYEFGREQDGNGAS